MIHSSDTRQRIEAAYQLLQRESTNREKFESARTLLHGINPQLDRRLDAISHMLSDVEKFQKGEVIELTAEHLPERTQEEKERKRSLILFIRTWKQLASEVERVRAEFEKMGEQESVEGKATSASKVVGLAKGPFGIIAIGALLLVGGLLLVNEQRSSSPSQSTTASSTPKTTVQVIIFNDKKVPVSELRIGEGPECDGSHYHAKDEGGARALDGTMVQDPGGCGYGKVKEVQIVEVE